MKYRRNAQDFMDMEAEVIASDAPAYAFPKQDILEILRLARLGVWAEEHGLRTLSMAWNARRALDQLPKDMA